MKSSNILNNTWLVRWYMFSEPYTTFISTCFSICDISAEISRFRSWVNGMVWVFVRSSAPFTGRRWNHVVHVKRWLFGVFTLQVNLKCNLLLLNFGNSHSRHPQNSALSDIVI